MNFLRKTVLCLAIAFAIMLTLSAVALGVGWIDLANRYAEVAYTFLVICVVTELIYIALESRFSREGSQNR